MYIDFFRLDRFCILFITPVTFVVLNFIDLIRKADSEE